MPVRAILPSVWPRPAPIACAPKIDAVMAIEMAGNCTYDTIWFTAP